MQIPDIAKANCLKFYRLKRNLSKFMGKVLYCEAGFRNAEGVKKPDA